MLQQENQANGNLTKLDQDNITANLSHAFTLPRTFGRVRRTVRSQLTGVLAKTTHACARPTTPTAATYPTPAGRSSAQPSTPTSPGS